MASVSVPSSQISVESLSELEKKLRHLKNARLTAEIMPYGHSALDSIISGLKNSGFSSDEAPATSKMDSPYYGEPVIWNYLSHEGYGFLALTSKDDFVYAIRYPYEDLNFDEFQKDLFIAEIENELTYCASNIPAVKNDNLPLTFGLTMAASVGVAVLS